MRGERVRAPRTSIRGTRDRERGRRDEKRREGRDRERGAIKRSVTWIAEGSSEWVVQRGASGRGVRDAVGHADGRNGGGVSKCLSCRVEEGGAWDRGGEREGRKPPADKPNGEHDDVRSTGGLRTQRTLRSHCPSHVVPAAPALDSPSLRLSPFASLSARICNFSSGLLGSCGSPKPRFDVLTASCGCARGLAPDPAPKPAPVPTGGGNDPAEVDADERFESLELALASIVRRLAFEARLGARGAAAERGTEDEPRDDDPAEEEVEGGKAWCGGGAGCRAEATP